jgi:hypothetical protein
MLKVSKNVELHRVASRDAFLLRVPAALLDHVVHAGEETAMGFGEVDAAPLHGEGGGVDRFLELVRHHLGE